MGYCGTLNNPTGSKKEYCASFEGYNENPFSSVVIMEYVPLSFTYENFTYIVRCHLKTPQVNKNHHHEFHAARKIDRGIFLCPTPQMFYLGSGEHPPFFSIFLTRFIVVFMG